MSLNDLHPIAELRRRQAHLFDNVVRAERPKKIVFYTMDTWQLGLIEQFLHLAFQLKGHEPKTIYYDGLLPITGWENHWVAPTPLEKLRQRAEFVFGAFGIPAVGITRYLDQASTRK